MNLLERIRKTEATKTSEPATLDEVRESLPVEPARRPFPPAPTTRPAWMRHQDELRAAAGGRLVATKEL